MLTIGIDIFEHVLSHLYLAHFCEVSMKTTSFLIKRIKTKIKKIKV